jgi:hypothetical protein
MLHLPEMYRSRGRHRKEPRVGRDRLPPDLLRTAAIFPAWRDQKRQRTTVGQILITSHWAKAHRQQGHDQQGRIDLGCLEANRDQGFVHQSTCSMVVSSKSILLHHCQRVTLLMRHLPGPAVEDQLQVLELAAIPCHQSTPRHCHLQTPFLRVLPAYTDAPHHTTNNNLRLCHQALLCQDKTRQVYILLA